MKIAVLGGGNGSFAAAGDFALQGHEVRLWRRDAEAVAEHKKAGSRIQVKNAQGTHDTQLTLVTTDIAEAIKDVELILCPAPAPASGTTLTRATSVSMSVSFRRPNRAMLAKVLRTSPIASSSSALNLSVSRALKSTMATWCPA